MKNSGILILTVTIFLLVCLVSGSVVIGNEISNGGDKLIERTDSLNEASIENRSIDPKISLEFAESALQLAQKGNYKKGEIIAFLNLGEANYELNNYRLALSNFRKADSTAEMSGNKKLEIEATYNIGVVHDILSQYGEALRYYKETRDKAKSTNNNKWLAAAYLKIGTVYCIQGFYDSALENTVNAARIFEKIDDSNGKQNALLQLGILSRDSGDFEKAEDYFSKTLELTKINKDVKKQGVVLGYFGLLHLRANKFSQALDYFQRSLDIREEIDDEEGMAISLNNIAKVYLEQEKYAESRAYFLRALNIRKKTGNLYGISESTKNIGLTYFREGKNDYAIEYLEESLNLATKENIRELIKENYFHLSEVFSANGNFKEAYESYIKFDSIEDSINASRNNRLYANLSIQHETYMKEKEIELLQSQNEKERYLRIFLIVLSILLILLGLVIYSKLVYKNRANEKITRQKDELEKLNKQLNEKNIQLNDLNNTKDKFFSIIAHDLKNPFTTLIGFSEILLTEYSQLSEDEKFHFIKEINATSTKSAMLLENLLNWASTQTGAIKLKMQNIDLYELSYEIVNLFEYYAKAKSLTIVNNIPQDTFCFADKFMISGVIRNLISNAIKFSHENGTIRIWSEIEKEMLTVNVSDEGTGISSENSKKLFKLDSEFSTPGTKNEKGTGLGLILTKDFVEKNGGEIYFNSEINKGTIFSFTVPISKEEVKLMNETII